VVKVMTFNLLKKVRYGKGDFIKPAKKVRYGKGDGIKPTKAGDMRWRL